MTETRPKTYFLQDAILRGFSAIEGRLDRNEGCRPFFDLRLRPQPELKHAIWDFGDMCSRYVDAFILGRQVTGCTDYQEEEQCLRALLHHNCDPFANPFMASRMLITFVDEYLQEPSRENQKRVENLVALIRPRLVFEDDYAFSFKAPAGWTSMKQPVFGNYTPYPTYPLGGLVLALSRFVESVDSHESVDLLQRLCRFILEVSGTFDADGRFQGHTHSGGILTSAVGILRWAIFKGDSRVVERMKNTFDWTRKNSSSWGWVPDGLGYKEQPSSETCSITDAIHLGLLIARHIDPGYYDIVERYARNQLMENQFLRPELAMPKGDHPQREAVTKALYGSWASWSMPNSLDNGLEAVEGCCLGSGIRACYLVWEHAVTKKAGKVMVNMAFSRNSPWVEVISYEPYEGRMDLCVHEAPILRVRIPGAVNEKDLKLCINGKSVPRGDLTDGYVEFSGLKKDDRIQIEYPLLNQETSEEVSGNTYQVNWRGNTVSGINPKGQYYPLFDREWIKQKDTPLVQCPYTHQAKGPVHW